jgi:hypothetical protein
VRAHEANGEQDEKKYKNDVTGEGDEAHECGTH